MKQDKDQAIAAIERGDHLAVGQHKATGLYHGLYYRNHPTPSGSDRYILSYSTNQGFETTEQAAREIESYFPGMPKLNSSTDPERSVAENSK